MLRAVMDNKKFDWFNMQETYERFKDMLDNKLVYDESIDVNSVDELVQKYSDFVEEDYK